MQDPEKDQIPGLFGDPPRHLVDVPDDSQQFSPTMPGSRALDECAASALASMTMLAAPGTVERRYDLACMLKALAPGGAFTVLAPKDMGGARLNDDLVRFGCHVDEQSKAHHRICRGIRPAALDETALREAVDGGVPRRVAGLGLWSQPGIFSWDRIDPGTSLLLEALADRATPRFRGHGADLGCGIGVLAHAVLTAPAVVRLDLIDIDRRAIDAARRNVDDPRVHLTWSDVRTGIALENLDFVVTNPPFHDGGHEDKSLGQVFIRQAAGALRKGGQLWLVANRHLPYEDVLTTLFRRVTPQIAARGFKVIEATK